MVTKEHRLSASLAMISQQGPHKMEGEGGGLHVETSNGPGLKWGCITHAHILLALTHHVAALH